MSSLEARLASKDATEMLASAMALVKAAGYRVTKPRAPKKKDRVGPTFVAQFADGQVTRMSTWTTLEKLDVERGKRLAQAAWGSRARTRTRTTWRPFSEALILLQSNPMMNQDRLADYVARKLDPTPPAILSAHFEQDGRVLAAYNFA